MSDIDDRDALAAEYVLGTLDRDERERAQALLESDAAFAAQVRGWERRLGALHPMVGNVEPAPDLWERVRARVAAAPAPEGMHLPPLPDGGGRRGAAPPDRDAQIVRLSRRVRRWRRMASLAGALAALLAVYLGLTEFRPDLLPAALHLRPGTTQTASAPPPPPPAPPAPSAPPVPSGRYVAVLQKDASAPAFLLTVDLDRRTLVIRRVAAEQEPGKSFELWLVSDKLPAPRSLGVVEGSEFTQRPTLAPYDRDTIDSATYAISLEPEGGSPTGTPTGPVLYLGKLVQATPDAAPTQGTPKP